MEVAVADDTSHVELHRLTEFAMTLYLLKPDPVTVTSEPPATEPELGLTLDTDRVTVYWRLLDVPVAYP